jgi:hypothetical protein
VVRDTPKYQFVTEIQCLEEEEKEESEKRKT